MNVFWIAWGLIIAVMAIRGLVFVWRGLSAKSYAASSVIDPATEMLLEDFGLSAIAIGRGTCVFSRIGGLPDLPLSHEWPIDPEGKPLAFLCQIALKELPAISRRLGFPPHGALFFFYCQDQSFGGDFPDHAPGWRVIYLPKLPPATPRTAPTGLKPKRIYTSAPLEFWTTTTYSPVSDAELRELCISADDYLAFLESRERPSPLHLMGGYPDSLHDLDMEERCELASNGIKPHDRKAYNSPQGIAIRERPRDWKLLLQLDSDDRAGMNWGDGGMLYFWIRASDLTAKDFSKVWLIGQTH